MGKEISPEESRYASEPSYRKPSDDGSPASHQQGPHANLYVYVDSDDQPRYLYGEQVVSQPTPSTVDAAIKETDFYMICSVFACLWCFWTALGAMYYSSKAREAAVNGDMEKAERMKVQARCLIISSMVISMTCVSVVIVMFLIINAVTE